MGSGKQRWKISFHKSPSSNSLPLKNQTQQPAQVPKEFLCPISKLIMADPVIVPSGHTFERNCVHACVSLSFTPALPGAADFSNVIPNLALKSTIFNWCHHHHIDPPQPIGFYSAQKLIQTLMNTENDENHSTQSTRDANELTRTPSEISVTSSDGSMTPRNSLITPLPLKTRPSCYSSSSSCDNDVLINPSFLEEEEIVQKLRSPDVTDQEEGLASLRKLTRTREDSRIHLCTPRLLSAIKTLISSRYASLQVNAVAGLVNLSLEKQNKVKIVRSGMIPPLIDLLHGGGSESQEHAAAALFSLALDDQNKTAIGVLGALPPLIHALRSSSERTRHDSAMALYHLSLVQSNRVKMIKFGSVQTLLTMVKSGHVPGRVMLILCNMAASVEGRAAMLDGGAVECFASMLNRDDIDSVSTWESCLAAFYGLSYGGLRFKGLAKEAGAEETIKKLEGTGSDRANEMTRRILEVLRKKDENDDEEIDWEELLNSEEDMTRTHSRLGRGNARS